LFDIGIEASEALPLLLFIGIGAMIDFGPVLSNPKMLLFGGAAQFGIFLTFAVASLLGFELKDAASIAIIGAADGPTSILVSNIFKSNYVSAIAVAAYSYMALVPIIQPFAIKLVTTKNERRIRMPYNPKSVSKTTRILFPIVVTMIAGFVAPESVSLVGFLMFGNLIRECGNLENLSETAQKTLANLVTLLLGLTISFKMQAEMFLSFETLLIMVLGLFAFVFDSIAGVLFAKFLNLFMKNKINPMVGAAGISAFPMSARVIQKMAIQEDNQNHILMHAVGANVAGQIASVVAGGLILALVPTLM
jgi:oxaloacetate decarboxylase beta subunit